MIREPDVLIHVDGVERTHPMAGVKIGLGTDDDGRRVLFLGSTNEMHRIEQALLRGEDVVARVPRFAVLSTSAEP